MSSAPTIRSFDFAQYRPAYRVDDSGLVELAGSTLGPGASDLLDIIEAVGTADRLAPRPDATGAGQPWTRSLELTIGVRQPHLWRGLSSSLEGLLEWLTDDEWQFDFAPRRSTSKLRDGEITGTLFSRLAGPRPVGLFSGGLDSLCGAVADLTAGQPLSLVSIESNSRMARSQRDLATALGGFGAFNLTGLSVRLHDTDQDESTQRTRGFTFLGLGAAAAYISGSTELRVYENGVGALNLPMSASQVGAHTSKAMHPSTLDRVATLLSEALNWPLSIVNPNMCHTKGEMCAYLLPFTPSCRQHCPATPRMRTAPRRFTVAGGAPLASFAANHSLLQVWRDSMRKPRIESTCSAPPPVTTLSHSGQCWPN